MNMNKLYKIPSYFGYQKQTLAIGLKILAYTLFAWNNALSKYLSNPQSNNPLDVMSIIGYQYLFVAFLLLTTHARQLTSIIKSIVSPWLHVVKALCNLLALTLLNYAFKNMPLTQATGFAIFSPCLTLVLSNIIFKEPINQRKSLSLLFGIIGYILLIQQPGISSTMGMNRSYFNLLAPSIAVMLFQANTFITKHLCNQQESSFNLTLSATVIISMGTLPYLITYPEHLSITQGAVLCIMGCNVLLAFFSINKAISLVEVSFFVPLVFIKQTIISCFGYLYFREIPSSYHLLGISFGILALTIITYKPHRESISNTKLL